MSKSDVKKSQVNQSFGLCTVCQKSQVKSRSLLQTQPLNSWRWFGMKRERANQSGRIHVAGKNVSLYCDLYFLNIFFIRVLSRDLYFCARSTWLREANKRNGGVGWRRSVSNYVLPESNNNYCNVMRAVYYREAVNVTLIPITINYCVHSALLLVTK